jgi:hypothetical protein
MVKGRTVPAVIMLIHDALLLFLIKKGAGYGEVLMSSI